MIRERNVINDRLSGWRLTLYHALYPFRGYWRSEEHPWMLMKISDGSWEVDGEVFFQQPEVQRQLKLLNSKPL
jgi:hypothetical protein